MIAPACRHNVVKRHGKDRYGNQRYRCILCGKTWVKQQPKPLGELRIDKTKAVLCSAALGRQSASDQHRAYYRRQPGHDPEPTGDDRTPGHHLLGNEDARPPRYGRRMR